MRRLRVRGDQAEVPAARAREEMRGLVPSAEWTADLQADRERRRRRRRNLRAALARAGLRGDAA